jgi:hypothetical protein
MPVLNRIDYFFLKVLRSTATLCSELTHCPDRRLLATEDLIVYNNVTRLAYTNSKAARKYSAEG